MQPFTTLTAIAAPMPKPNINTDDIFPAPGASPIAKKMGREAFADPARMGPNAFAVLRWDADGEPKPDFILNRPPYDQAQILIAGANFGCGSSREMAVWCLMGTGIRCVIAPSFGDIFYNNCFKNGLLPVRLPEAQVAALAAQAAKAVDPVFTVDLIQRTVCGPDAATYAFEVVDYYRDALLNGLDEISATLTRMDNIRSFEAAYAAERSWLTF